MPFQRHVVLNPPEDWALSIWRYMDLARLLWTAQNGALWFARADQLGDPWEGSISAATFAQGAGRVPRIAKAWRLKTAVSCWHMSQHESFAMWDRYGRSQMGIAIRSTIDRLIGSFHRAAENIFVSPVRYIDYDAVPMSMDNAFYPLIHKRQSLLHESELRAVTTFPEPTTDKKYDLTNNPLGVAVSVDLHQLVEAIYVAPFAPSWLHQTVAQSVAELGVPVHHSRLGEDPLF